MDFIKNTSPKYIQVRFLAQKNAQKRAQTYKKRKLRWALRSAN